MLFEGELGIISYTEESGGLIVRDHLLLYPYFRLPLCVPCGRCEQARLALLRVQAQLPLPLHLATLSVSIWILLCASSLSGCENAIARSSAKALSSVSSPNSSRRSSINIMNSVGDRTAPCSPVLCRCLMKLQ